MVSHLFLGEYRSRTKPAGALPGDLGKDGYPQTFLAVQISFSGPINSNHVSAMGPDACKNFLEKWKPPYLAHPKQQLQAREITVPQLACEPRYRH